MQGLSDEADEIARAEQRATGRKFGVSRGLQSAGQGVETLLSRPHAKWILAVAVVGAGAAAAFALARRARSRRGWLLQQAEPSRWQNAAKAAGVWLFRIASRRIAQEVALRLTEPHAATVAPAPAVVPPRPRAVQ